MASVICISPPWPGFNFFSFLIIVFGNIEFDKDYNDDDLNIVLKNIYETNFFKEINLKINNSILEISVIENPIIEDVQINGIKSENLTELLFDKIKLKNRSSYIELLFLSDLNLIKNFDTDPKICFKTSHTILKRHTFWNIYVNE